MLISKREILSGSFNFNVQCTRLFFFSFPLLKFRIIESIKVFCVVSLVYTLLEKCRMWYTGQVSWIQLLFFIDIKEIRLCVQWIFTFCLHSTELSILCIYPVIFFYPLIKPCPHTLQRSFSQFLPPTFSCISHFLTLKIPSKIPLLYPYYWE